MTARSTSTAPISKSSPCSSATDAGRWPIEAFTELRFAGSTKVVDIAGIAADLPEVDAVHTIAGGPDALVHMRVRDVGDLTRVSGEAETPRSSPSTHCYMREDRRG